MEKKSKLTTKKLIIMLAAIFLVCGAALGILAFLNHVKQVASDKDYGYVNTDETKADADAGITIDGVLDEKVYQNNNWLYLRNDNGNAVVDIATTSYYGEKGMYFVYDVTESTPIYVNLSRSSALNSCIEMYLALSDVTSMDSSEIFEIDLLPTGDMVFKQRNGKGAFMDVATTDDKMAYLGATTKGGEINTEDCNGYCLEFFIPWEYLDFLGMDVESMKTDYVFVNTAHITSYNYAGTAETDRYWYSFAQQLGGNGWGNVSLYYRFNEDGVIGTVPVELVEGDHYTISGRNTVIPGTKTHVTITPEEGYALNSILVNGEEYIKKVSYNDDGSVALDIRGVKEGLSISASAVAVTEGNKTLSGTVKVHKVGGDSLKGVTASYVGPNGEKPIELDAAGSFVLTDLKQGFYKITVEKEGYEKIERGIFLNRDIDTELTLEYLVFEVESGRCWQLEEVNDGIINKMGGFGSLLTTDSYKNFTVEANFKYYEDVAESLEEQDREEQRQGIRIKFSNDKYWHIDLLYQNEKYFIQYAKATTASIFNFRDIYTLSDEEIAKFKSEDGINLKVVRDGNRAIIYLGGNLIAVEDLDKEYTNLTAKVGFESWGPFTEVKSMEYKISSGTPVNVHNLYFGYHKNWDVTKQFEGYVTQPKGGNTVWLRFFEKLTDIDMTIKVLDNPKSDNTVPSTNIRFEFDNDKVFIASIGVNSGDGTIHIWNQKTSTNAKTKSLYQFTAEEQAQYMTEEGIDFRFVRSGTELLFFVGDEYKTSVDLSEYIEENTPAIVSIQHVGDKDVPYVMPFTVSEKTDSVTITQKESAGKAYKTEKGTTVTVSAEEGYYIKELSLNGKDVSDGLTWDGRYIFVADEANYTMKATLAKRIFDTNYGWNLLEQNQGTVNGVTTGVVTLPNGGTTTSALSFIKKYADMDLTWRVKDHPNSDAANTTAPRTSIEFIFDEVLTGENKKFTLSVSDSNKGVVQIQNTSGLKDKAYTSYYNFDADETAKYRSADGVDVRIVRDGTDFILFVDGELKAVVDLSKYIKADTKATVRITHNDDSGVQLDMPYAVTDKVDIGKIYFGYHVNWDVTNQFDGSVMQPNGGNTVWLRFFEKIATMDLNIKVLDNPNSEDGVPSTNVRFEFDNGETFIVSVGENSSDGTIHLWNQNNTTINNSKYGKSLYTFSDEEQAQYNTEDGIDFRVVRNGTDILFFIGGEYKTCVDLSEYIEGDTPAIVSIQHVGDKGVPYVMPFTLAEELELVTIQTEANDGKKLTTDRTSYVVGQEVNVETEEGYYIKKITVNGKDDSTNLNIDGTYTFIATEKEYKLVATVKECVFSASSGWNILNQDEGVVSRPDGGKTDAWLDFYDKYTTMDLTLNLKDEPEVDGETRTTVRVKFDNEAKDTAYFSVVSQGGALKFQTTPGTIHTKYTTHATWTDAEKTLYESEDGIDFRIVRDGTKFIVYMQDGTNPDLMNRIQEFDFSDYIEKGTKATVSIQREGDVGTEITIPFSVTDTLPEYVQITAKDQNDEKLVTDLDKYLPGDVVTVSAKDGYYCKEMTVNGKAVTLALDGTYSFVAKEKEYNITAVVAEKLFVTQTGWDLREQNGGTKNGVTTGKVTLPNGGVGKGDGYLYFDEKYTDIDLTITAKDDPNASGEPRTSVAFIFGDKAVAISLTQNSKGVVVQNYPAISNTINKSWTDYKVLESSEVEQYKSQDGTGLELRAVRKGTDLVICVEDVDHDGVMEEAAYIDLSAYEIDAAAEATVGIRHEGESGTAKEIPFKFTTNVVATAITTSMNDTYGTYATQNTHNFVGDKILMKRTSYDGVQPKHLAGVKVDGEKTINLDADATCSFVSTKEAHSVEGIYRNTIFTERSSSNWNLTQQNQGTDADGTTSGVVSVAGGKYSWLYLYETDGKARYGDIDLTYTLKDFGGSGNSWYQIKFTFYDADSVQKGVLLLSVIESNGKATFEQTDHSSMKLGIGEICELDYTKYTSDGIDVRVKREGTKILLYVDDVFQKSIDLSGYIENEYLARVCIAQDKDSGKQIEIPYKLSFPEKESIAGKYFSILGDQISMCSGMTVTSEANSSVSGNCYDTMYGISGKAPNGNIDKDENNLYWGQSRVTNGLNLLVNNSSSHSRLTNGVNAHSNSHTPGYLRVEELAQEQDGQGEIVKTPDIIYLYMGTEDYRYNQVGSYSADTAAAVKTDEGYITPTTFTEAYVITLEKIKELYPNAEVFCFTLLPLSHNASPYTDTLEANRTAYNNRIKEIASDYEKVTIVDSTDVITKDNFITDGYFSQQYSDILPYKKAHDVIAAKLQKALESQFKVESEITLNNTGNGSLIIEPKKDVYGIGDTVTIKATPESAQYYLDTLKIDGAAVTVGSDGTYTFTISKVSHTVESTFRKKIFADNSTWDLTQQNQGTDENGVTSGVISYTDSASIKTDDAWLYLYTATAKAKEYGDVDLTLNIRNYDDKFSNSNTQIKFETAASSGYWFRFVVQETDAGGVNLFRTGYGGLNTSKNPDYKFSAEEVEAYKSDKGINIQVKREGTMFYFYVDGVLRYSLNLSSEISSNTKSTVCILRDNDIGIATPISYKLSFPK